MSVGLPTSIITMHIITTHNIFVMSSITKGIITKNSIMLIVIILGATIITLEKKWKNADITHSFHFGKQCA